MTDEAARAYDRWVATHEVELDWRDEICAACKHFGSYTHEKGGTAYDGVCVFWDDEDGALVSCSTNASDDGCGDWEEL